MAGLLQKQQRLLLHKAASFPGLSLLFSTVVGVSFQVSTKKHLLGSSQSFALQKRTLSIGGVYPPIATPFEKGDEEAIAWKHLRENLTKWNQVKSLRGYLVQGSNGEYCYLTTQERIEMISKVRQWSSKDKLVLAGSGMESTAATIEMTLAMAEAGADAAVVITPCYFKNRMTNEALVSHFTAVADKSSIPIILYSVPANTGLDLSVEVVIRLAQHSNIIGIKDSGGDVTKIGHMVHATRDDKFSVLAGSAGFLLPALQVGAVGGICALANCLPREVAHLQELYSTGEWAEAKALQHRLIRPNMMVTKGLGVPGLKKAMDWKGYYGGPVRRPLLPLNPPEENSLKKVFQDETFLSASE